jgi:hypothetical protein
MTKSCRVEGARGNPQVPPMEHADAERRRLTAGGTWGKPGFPHEPEPKAEVAA